MRTKAIAILVGLLLFLVSTVALSFFILLILLIGTTLFVPGIGAGSLTTQIIVVLLLSLSGIMGILLGVWGYRRIARNLASQASANLQMTEHERESKRAQEEIEMKERLLDATIRNLPWVMENMPISEHPTLPPAWEIGSIPEYIFDRLTPSERARENAWKTGYTRAEILGLIQKYLGTHVTIGFEIPDEIALAFFASEAFLTLPAHLRSEVRDAIKLTTVIHSSSDPEVVVGVYRYKVTDYYRIVRTGPDSWNLSGPIVDYLD